jgi:hypothetical protein
MQKRRFRAMLAVAALSALTLAGAARVALAVDAEAIPEEFAQQFAPFVVQLVQQQVPDPPVKVDPVPEKSQGMHIPDSLGVVVMPDRALDANAVSGAKDKKVPAGLLLTRALTIKGKNGAVPADQLSLLDFMEQFKLPVMFLEVKGAEEKRHLLIHSKPGKDPLAEVELKKGGENRPSLQVKLSEVEVVKKSARLTFFVPGGYEGTIELAIVEL